MRNKGVSILIAFFFKIILTGGQLLYNIAIHQHESDTGAHFFLLHFFEDSYGLVLVIQ